MSEEKNQIQPEQSDLTSWEAQFQARANELLTQRTNAMKAEIERLQANIAEINSRLLEQTEAPPEQEAAGLLDYVKQWFSDSTAKAEEGFKSRLEDARAAGAAGARVKAEAEFKTRLEEARRQWQEGRPSEEVFQKRLEQACAEAAAVARRQSEAQIEDLREQLEASRKALTLAVSSSQSASPQTANLDAIKAAIEEIDSQRTQSDILTALIRRAAQFAPRVVFFVVKSSDAVGWKAKGFENGLNDETARLLTVPGQNQTLLRDALTSFRTTACNPESLADYSAVLGLYGSPMPERAVAVPLVIRNKAAAVLYADSGTQIESSINTAAIESLMRVAGLVIELLPYRRGAEPARASVPSAQLTPSAAAVAPAPDPAVEQAARPTEIVSAQPEFKPEDRFEAQAESPKPVEVKAEPPEAWPVVEQVPEPVPVTAAEVATGERITVEAKVGERITEELPPAPTGPALPEGLHHAEAQLHQPSHIEAEPSAVEPRFEWTGSEVSEKVSEPVSERVSEPVSEKVSEPPQFEYPSPLPPSTPSFAPRPVINDSPVSAPTMPMTNFVPPPVEQQSPGPGYTPPSPPVFKQPAERPKQAQPGISVPTPASETEQRAHNDARRFARLLVSEIKLYNAAKVNDGRRNYDLYDRLKDEIDRSRKVYDKRVSPAVASRFDYFYDELVQTLAEGDPAKLGKNCPGPVVLASN